MFRRNVIMRITREGADNQQREISGKKEMELVGEIKVDRERRIMKDT